MTSLNNLEKLIQMATIEQMYSMLQKMKIDNDDNNKSQEPTEKCSNQNDALISALLNEHNFFKDEISNLNQKFRKYDAEIWKLTETIKFLEAKIEYLETDLSEIKNNTNNNSKYLCQQIRGQQTLNSYLGLSSEKHDDVKEEEHIKLKIEEMRCEEMKCEELHTQDEEDELDLDDELEESDEDDVNPPIITCSTILLTPSSIIESKQEVEEQEVKEEEEQEVEKKEESEEEEEEVEEEVSEEEEEVSEEEVETEDEVTEIVNKKEEKVEVEEEEEEEEEEEVFEIEIDDVTYFATHEENGILYEITSDGDVGKKVGIIKDGEPIFN